MTSPHEYPVLENSRFLRFFAFTFLYVSQGLPWGIFVVGIPAWLAGQGYSAADIGALIALAGLPWSFKLIAGPLMDRFTFLAMGRRRPWVMGAQAGIILGLVILAFVDPVRDGLMVLAWTGFLINSFCALQDVAVDGMAIDVLKENERARANAFMYGGQVAGISLSSSGTAWAMNQWGLDAAAFIFAGLVLVIMLIPVILRERQGEKLLPWTAGEASTRSIAMQEKRMGKIVVDVVKVLVLPMSVLLVICEFLNRAAAGLTFAIAPVVVVQQAGWLDTDYANWQAMGGIAAAVFGVLVSPWIDKRGAGLALIVATLAKIILFVIVGMSEAYWAVPGFFETVLVSSYLFGQVVTVAIIALFMNICVKKVSATQFAAYMASANLAFAAGSAMAGLLEPILEYRQIFYVGALMNVLFLVVWPLFSLDNHKQRVRQLEASYQS